MIFFSNKNRPFDWGPYALERLPRDASKIAAEMLQQKAAAKCAAKFPRRVQQKIPWAGRFPAIMRCSKIFRERPPAKTKAPLPDDPRKLVADMKRRQAISSTASHMGICELSGNCWLEGVEVQPHSHAIVVLVKYGRTPEPGTLAPAGWRADEHAAAALRALEIALCLAGQINIYGWAARVHDGAVR